MPASRFAALARLAAAHGSRRGVLTSSLGSTLTSLGAASLRGAEETRAKKKRKKKRGCSQWILSGSPDSSSPIPRFFVDDDVTVFVNGQIVFQDEDEGSGSVGPLLFEARRGDRLRIVAVDIDTDCYELSPLYLRCACGGPPRKLSDGVPEVCDNQEPAGEFFNETFTI